MSRPCTCDRAQKGPRTEDQCPLCWLYHNSDAYRNLWDNPDQSTQTVSVPTIKKLPCVHLGESTGETQECPSCAGKVMVKLFHCSIYNECTIYKNIEGKACCNNCKDYKPKEGI